VWCSLRVRSCSWYMISYMFWDFMVHCDERDGIDASFPMGLPSFIRISRLFCSNLVYVWWHADGPADIDVVQVFIIGLVGLDQFTLFLGMGHQASRSSSSMDEVWYLSQDLGAMTLVGKGL
jgi:hypothetical protein